jgi:hypothetical protein
MGKAGARSHIKTAGHRQRHRTILRLASAYHEPAHSWKWPPPSPATARATLLAIAGRSGSTKHVGDESKVGPTEAERGLGQSTQGLMPDFSHVHHVRLPLVVYVNATTRARNYHTIRLMRR